MSLFSTPSRSGQIPASPAVAGQGLASPPAGHRRWRLRHLRHQQAGISALEFALVAPLVLLIIFATLEFALVMMADISLESAVSRAQRDSQYHWSEPHACQGNQGAVHSNVLANLSGWVTHPDSLQVTLREDVLPPVETPPASSRLPCTDVNPGWAIFEVELTRAGVLGVLNSFGLRVFRLKRNLVVRNLP